MELGNTKIDFESSPEVEGGFALLTDGKEKLQFNQFYLMEYRTPGENYLIDGKTLSFNMDNNIEEGVQSFFLPEGNSLSDRFRMVTFDYRPGVVVWYFNSKFDRVSNDPTAKGGKGYLLVLNSKVKEVPIPGIYQDAKYFDENGHYFDDEKVEWFKNELKEVRELFGCYAYSNYYTYVNGNAPIGCSDSDRDHLKSVTFDGKPLIYRRERFNELLPLERYKNVAVDHAFRNFAGMRTGLSPFNPASEGDFAPFKVYKEVEGKMVIDHELTAKAATFKAVDSFDDKDNKFSEFQRFQGDSVAVEKTGFKFKVVAPSSRVTAKYSKDTAAEENDNWFRRPRAKVYFSWSKPKVD